MANIPDTENTAKMKKRLGRENNAQLGLFTKPDGSKCTPTESAEQMILTHFPNSLPRPPHTVRRPLAEEVDITDPKADFINPTSVKACIESFKTLDEMFQNKICSQIITGLRESPRVRGDAAHRGKANG